LIHRDRRSFSDFPPQELKDYCIKQLFIAFWQSQAASDKGDEGHDLGIYNICFAYFGDVALVPVPVMLLILSWTLDQLFFSIAVDLLAGVREFVEVAETSMPSSDVFRQNLFRNVVLCVGVHSCGSRHELLLVPCNEVLPGSHLDGWDGGRSAT
jgi:hypothetical protein